MSLEKFLQKYGNVTEEYKFYNDTISLRYDPKKHVYYRVTPEGLIKLFGVTTVTKIIDKSDILIPWGCKMMEQKFKRLLDAENSNEFQYDWLIGAIKNAKSAHKDKLEEAGAIGKETHNWIESFIKDLLHGTKDIQDFPENKKVQNAAVAALDWITKHNVRWLHTERKVYSKEHDYAGTTDGICLVDSCTDTNCCPVEFKDHLTLVDWKTSNYLYVEYILQTAAYKSAFEEELGLDIKDIWLVRLGKDDGKFETWHLTDEAIQLGWEAFLAALNLSRAMVRLREA